MLGQLDLNTTGAPMMRNTRVQICLLALAIFAPSACAGDIDDDPETEPTNESFNDVSVAISSISISPTMDTYVRSAGFADTNFGSNASLRADLDASGSVEQTYLKFSVG